MKGERGRQIKIECGAYRQQTSMTHNLVQCLAGLMFPIIVAKESARSVSACVSLHSSFTIVRRYNDWLYWYRRQNCRIHVVDMC